MMAIALLVFPSLTTVQVIEKGLISYWTFDKTDIQGDVAKDIWGENDGKIVGAKSNQGSINEALKFDGDGDGDYVDVPDFRCRVDGKGPV